MEQSKIETQAAAQEAQQEPGLLRDFSRPCVDRLEETELDETASVAPSHAPSNVSAAPLQADAMGLQLDAFSTAGLESAVARFDAMSSSDSCVSNFARGTEASADEEPRRKTLEAVAEYVHQGDAQVFEGGEGIEGGVDEEDTSKAGVDVHDQHDRCAF